MTHYKVWTSKAQNYKITATAKAVTHGMTGLRFLMLKGKILDYEGNGKQRFSAQIDIDAPTNQAAMLENYGKILPNAPEVVSWVMALKSRYAAVEGHRGMM